MTLKTNRRNTWLAVAYMACLLLCAFGFVLPAAAQTTKSSTPSKGSVAQSTSASGKSAADTTEVKSRFEVARTSPDTEEDLETKTADLKNPENLKTETTYDDKNHTYIVGTKIGDSYLSVPLLMTPEEYQEWSMKRSLNAFFKAKNEEEFEKEGKKEKFDFTDMHFDLGPAEKVFGPGGVQIKTQGTAELKFGFNQKSIDNPTLPQRSRNTFGFDFDEKINLSINGKVGDKVNMNMNYNTEATFNYDTKKMKLKYEGKEDEIIKLLEAGNVSFPTNSSLINGSTSLFGIRADLQFGKLSLQTVVSQKTSQSTSVSSKGGKQTTEFEIDVADYDENRHFFLAHYFRDTYDQSMAQLPTIMSGVKITRIEVWITNKTSSFDNPRNLIAFTDLAEAEHISNRTWRSTGTTRLPSNGANDLYYQMVNTYSEVRDIDRVGAVLGDFLSGSTDYEKIANARLLSSSEYTLNSTLGYISLRSALKSDEVLAVAFEYTQGGKTYQVGEFAADQKESGKSLYVKLLKSNSMSPSNGTWDLMMKNIYSLGAKSLSSADFRLNIEYESDSTGTNLIYLPEGKLKDKTLLQLVNLDRLDAKQNANPNGFFDYVEGFTVNSSNGQIIFPVVEPFGGWLRKVINDDAVANKYVFEELYDSTKTTAKQIAEKNKFLLTGEYSGSGGNIISLGAYNIPRGSVVVTAGGVTLTENSDYTVNYGTGEVEIINQSIIDAGTAVNVSLESNTTYNMQRKTMLGMNWAYDFTKDFKLGGTMMYLNEKPLTSKVGMGEEPLKNTLWGLNMAWKHESQLLTNMLDYLPGLHVTQPSSINFTAEFAQLIAGVSDMVQGSASYIDDFESSERDIRLNTPSAWMLASIPSTMPYASLTNDIRTGKDRALFNWYTIDPLFTRRNSTLTPAHLKSDLEQLSNHYVREIYERDLYPNKESTYGESSTLSVLNLAYYPDERGPYNFDTDLTREGKLTNPKQRWGGMMRQLTTTDFETSNIEYVEFWMMDPFIYNPEAAGGDFYIDLGEVSEDILKDGKKFYENGMTASVNTTDSINYEETVWGRVPKARSLVYAFDNNAINRDRQDVGYDGLTSSEENSFATHKAWLDAIQEKVNPDVFAAFRADPSGDDFHHYRGADYDAQELSILERYKRYNGTEGNSLSTTDTDSYDKSAKTTPDVEDINQDYTLDEYEKYFEYHVSLRPQDMQMGRNHITDVRTVKSKLRNGNFESVNWYKFRVPIDNYESVVGSIRDFTNIRFMRVYMTGFSEPVIVRLASLSLISGTWRNYDQPIYSAVNSSPKVSGSMVVSSVNIEENGDRSPVNYTMPPGITRILDPNQPQLRQDNEQAMSIQVTGLEPGEARAVYKKDNKDLRKYEHIQMFIHAEQLTGSDLPLEDNQISVFVRIGSDYKSNYYEYEIPLTVTPEGYYDGNTTSGCRSVWPEENMLDIDFSKFTELKRLRNMEMNVNPDVTKTTIYSAYDEDCPKNRISVIGNPTIGKVKTIMIGVRNNSRSTRSAEIWCNELRLTGFQNQGGWAAQSALNVQLSDVGSMNVSGHAETAGFGGLEQGVSQRRDDDLYRYAFTTNFDLGRFFPEKLKLSVPLYYSISQEKTSPLYSPFDTDLYLDDMMETLADDYQRDSLLRIANEVVTSRNFSLSNVKMNVTSKKPMPYDPANFSFGYSRSTKDNGGNTIDYQHDLNWKAQAAYAYAPALKAWEPFKNLKSESKWLAVVKEFGISPLPQSITLGTDMTRVYHELQMRDLEGSYGAGGIPVSFSQEFLWNRKMTLRWDLTKNIKSNFASGTNAEIEEPFAPVNSAMYPDQYELWKDSVRYSIAQMGRPLTYQQTFAASWQLPLSKIPVLDWTTFDASWNSSYNWKRGATLRGGGSYGSTIANQRAVTLNGKINLETLYNKVDFLKETNKKFASSGAPTRQGPGPVRKKPAPGANAAKTPAKPKKYITDITVVPDSTYTITHGLGTKRPEVGIRTKEGRSYPVRTKVVDANTIRFTAPDSADIKITVGPGPKLEEMGWYKGLQYSTRFLMMVRNASFTYKNTYAMTLPGFMPEMGGMLGQSTLTGDSAPGWDFAFGMTGDDYLQRAHDRGWLLSNDSVAYSSSSSNVEELQAKVTLEPFRDFKIDVNGNWMKNNARTVQFMYPGMPETRTGQFNMTTITLGSAFEPRRSSDGYHSAWFDRFIEALPKVHERVERQYEGLRYPQGSAFAGEVFDRQLGTLSPYSPDVMIPTFLSVYSGRSAETSALTLFPSMLSMLPNWKITYGGLGKLAFFQKYFKSVNINHAYKSVYSVGSFGTYSSFLGTGIGELGFVDDVISGSPIPSTMFDISSVTISEQFSPLIGVDVTTPGNLTAKLEYKKSRNMNLSMTAVQLVETASDDIVVGAGYKIVGLKLFGAGHSTAPAKNKVSNDMNLRLDVSYRDQSALCRNIQDLTTQATSGNKAVKVSLSADYAYSKMLTLNAYFDHQTNIPVVSASAYPTSTNDFGVSLKFSLTK